MEPARGESGGKGPGQAGVWGLGEADRRGAGAGTPTWLARVPALLSSLLGTLAGLALSLVLVVFMLLKHKDLRNRLIRLVSRGQITVMTKALDDAGQHISRFLLMQLIVNATARVGLSVGLGLLAIGVQYAFLWGFLAAVFRYIPYTHSISKFRTLYCALPDYPL